MLCIVVFTKCINNQNEQKQNDSTTGKEIYAPVTYDQFAGSEVCAKCHQSITNDYTHTAHFLTSQLASPATIKGSFKKGQNSFTYDVGKIVSLEKQAGQFLPGLLSQWQRGCKTKV